MARKRTTRIATKEEAAAAEAVLAAQNPLFPDMHSRTWAVEHIAEILHAGATGDHTAWHKAPEAEKEDTRQQVVAWLDQEPGKGSIPAVIHAAARVLAERPKA